MITRSSGRPGRAVDLLVGEVRLVEDLHPVHGVDGGAAVGAPGLDRPSGLHAARAPAKTAGPVLVSRWPTAMAVPGSPGVGPPWYQPTSFGLSTGGVAEAPVPDRARGPTIGASMPRDGTRKGSAGTGAAGGAGASGGRGTGGGGRPRVPRRPPTGHLGPAHGHSASAHRSLGVRPTGTSASRPTVISASGPPVTSASGPAAATVSWPSGPSARSARRHPCTGPPPSPGRP